MNATQITVPSKSGAQGDSIENYVLDRVSGDIEKNLGQVVENAMEGASVPVAAVVVLDGSESIRRAYIFTAVSASLASAVEATRDAAVSDMFANAFPDATVGTSTLIKLELEDPASTLKGKTWVIPGLTQTASIAGTSGNLYVDGLFVPTKKSYTLASLIAKMEDIAIDEPAVMVYVNQAFPEVFVFVPDVGPVDSAALASIVGESAVAQINGVFISETEAANPKFGFESGAGF